MCICVSLGKPRLSRPEWTQNPTSLSSLSRGCFSYLDRALIFLLWAERQPFRQDARAKHPQLPTSTSLYCRQGRLKGSAGGWKGSGTREGGLWATLDLLLHQCLWIRSLSDTGNPLPEHSASHVKYLSIQVNLTQTPQHFRGRE